MTISQMIFKGHIENAVKELLKKVTYTEDEDTLISIMSNYDRLRKQKITGTIDNSEYILRINQITQSLLQLNRELSGGKNTNNILPTNNTRSVMTTEDKLSFIIQETKRRNPVLATKAKTLLDKIREYGDKKALSHSFDASGKRQKLIQLEINELAKEWDEFKGNTSDNFADQVRDIIDNPEDLVPSWDKLEKAYTILVGRGLSNSNLKESITLKPNDDEAKIVACEIMEEYLNLIV